MKNEFIRTFVCLELSHEVKEILSSIISRLKDDRDRIKWVQPDQLHITLKFLGNTEVGLVPQIGEVLEEVAITQGVFRITLKGLGSFLSGKRMRVVWVGVEEGKTQIIEIWRKLDGRLSALGFNQEGREYIPHVTLGRIKYLSDPFSFIRKLKKYENETFDEYEVTTITLMKSTLLPTGPIYEPLTTKSFKGKISKTS